LTETKGSISSQKYFLSFHIYNNVLLSEEVAVLLWSESIDLAAPVCKLAGCDLLVDLERNVVHHLTWLTAYL
jgi:hypothetical protein